MRVLRGNVGGRVDRLAFSADGRLAVAAQGQSYLDVWDITTDRLADFWKTQGHRHRVQDLAFLPNGQLLVALDDLPPQLLDGGDCLPGVVWPADRLIVLPAVNQLVVRHPGRGDYRSRPLPLTAWDVTLRPFAALWERPDNVQSHFALPADGTLLVSAAWERPGPAEHPCGILEVTDAISGDVRRRTKLNSNRSGTARVMAMSADGRHVLVGHWTVWEVWQTATWQTVADVTLPIPNGSPDVAVHPDGRRFFSAGHGDGLIRVWEWESLRVVAEYELPAGPACSISISPDGAVAAAGSDGGKIVVWDVDL